MKYLLNILFFLSYGTSLVFAQYPYSSKITSPDPLPTPVIYDMLGDSKGYLWLASDKGLIKFNSRSFQILPFNNTLLKSIGYLNEDEDGKIWCANFYKQIFYLENDSLKLFEIKSSSYKELNNILNISVTKKSIFISSFKTIFEIDKSSHEVIKQINANENNNVGFQYSIHFNKEFYYYSNDNSLKNNRNVNLKASINNQFLEIRLASDGTKIVAIERGKRNRNAFLFDGKTIKQLPQFKIPLEDYVYHLATTGENEFWICTQNGAYLWDYLTGNVQLLFAKERVSDVVKDFQGNYWFSTLDNGLFKCPNLNCKKVGNIFEKGDNATKISALNNHHFAIGNTKGEVVEIDNFGRKVQQFKTITNDEIEFLYFDKTQKKIFSDGGLFNTVTTTTITNIDFGKSVAKDAYGNIIVASFNRCAITTNRFDAIDTINAPKNNTLYKSLQTTYIVSNGKRVKLARLLRNKRATWVCSNENRNGFWVAYEDDLYYYDYGGIISILKDKEGKSILATHLQQFNKQLFVSTTTNGLIVLNEYNIQDKKFTTANGLQSNNAKKSIIANEKIWLLTDVSLEMIDPSTSLVQDFFSSVGLELLTVYDFAIDNNTVLLATTNGLMYYTKSENNLGERIKITLLQVENSGKQISSNTTLEYSQNSIIVKLDAIHYKAPSKLFFHYRLIGSDTAWHTVAAANNLINYNFLPSGQYEFEVYAADANMIFRSPTKSFSFTIAKPFWATASFISLIIISVLGSIFFLIWWWAKQFKRKQLNKESLLQSKLTAIRSQMNPHFLYNVLNTVQGLVYANKKTEAATTLANFSDLMRKTLEVSDKSEIVLTNEIESLQLYLELEKKRFNNEFEYCIDITESIEIEHIQVPSMFIQPFAENAIKHGLLHLEGKKKLTITIIQEDKQLQISIDDNGIGRMRSAIINQNLQIKSAGFALKGISERIDIYNAMNKQKIKFLIIDKEIGTLVNLSLPIKEII
jgi:ligand-binding sensor domain-containing protein